ncbi:MAG TPA: hypothetical protein [Caudoviricetes sp.]|nr:MAG TPA: hypothetical protein [Caudoviricetes sp.]
MFRLGGLKPWLPKKRDFEYLLRLKNFQSESFGIQF